MPAREFAPRADAAWATQDERSNALALRLARWIAVTLGRRVSRLVLHPTTLYFLVFGGAARRASADYLRRVLGRKPTWVDRYRHLYHFTATILAEYLLASGVVEELACRATRVRRGYVHGRCAHPRAGGSRRRKAPPDLECLPSTAGSPARGVRAAFPGRMLDRGYRDGPRRNGR